VQRYVVTQLSLFFPTVLGIVTLAFLLVRIVPGDPAAVMLGDTMTPESLAALRQQLKLDDPLPLQYLGFLADVVRGNLGNSLMTKRPVFAEIMVQMPATVQLAIASVIVGSLLGIPLGIIAAVKRGTFVDQASMIVALLGVTMPSFWLALLLLLLFAVYLGWLPAIGAGDGSFVGNLRALILPTITLAIGLAGLLARITRSAMLEVLGEDYVRTARAKGLASGVVLVRHAMRNAALPIVTVLGLQVGNLLAGTVLIETIFVRQGLGSLVVQAVFNRDYPMVQGCVIVLATMFVLLNLVVDLLYGLFDPRIRYS
jgi:peptide/nickel transport system permease protein